MLSAFAYLLKIMKPQTILICLVVMIALIGLLSWGYAKNGNTAAAVQGVESNGAKSALVATSTFYDFSTISMKNGNVTKDFIFTNPTDKEIVIKRTETSCMCTQAFLVEPDGSIKGPFGMASMGANTSVNETIKAGGSRTLRVVYNPNAHGPAGVGQIDRFAIITDSAGARLQFEIKALVTP